MIKIVYQANLLLGTISNNNLDSKLVHTLDISLSDMGSWASIIGLLISVLTYFLTRSVKKEVNLVLKNQKDKNFFDNRVRAVLRDLKEIQNIAEEENSKMIWSNKTYSKINSAIELVRSTWDILYEYDNKIMKQYHIRVWTKKFRKVEEMYNGGILANNKTILVFLNELVTFLEKETSNHE